MSRLLSVALTEDAVVRREKTVTRRLGWRFLKAGDHLTLVRKSMGRKPGEPVIRLAEVQVVDVRRERLDAIDIFDVGREGFPHWSTDQFVGFFTSSMKCSPGTVVTRVEWVYLDGGEP